ncbi:hypothetical protein [Burkholderia anthina]|uniref:hypothetical protein n=1 Tax=Burkholderia anthina TaxID=179879 RepID=UPI00158DBC83|nr:hypothetical protein [Burkholderia anthina]
MRIGRIGSIAALSMAAAMAELAPRNAGLEIDRFGETVRFVRLDRGQRQAAQWKRETGQVKRKGRQ